MKDQPHYIVVINDDQAMRLSCYKILRKEGYKIATFDDGIVGLEHISQRKPDLLIIDLKMPQLGGIEIISRVHAIDSDICIVVITGYTTLGAAAEAIKNGAYDFLPQPFTADELRIIVRRALERRMLEKKAIVLKQENERLQRRFTTFVSHQLQSPLADMKRYLEALEYLPDTPKRQQVQKEWIDFTLTRITELLELVSNWLKISKI
ncbi:MAG: response regulator [Calditrichaeota bacterium]|nr:response regulator [Calditrichota bacterium]